MPKGSMHCPICKGTGTITENTRDYEFITRDPATDRCLICSGTGWIGPQKRLPDGQKAHTFAWDNQPPSTPHSRQFVQSVDNPTPKLGATTQSKRRAHDYAPGGYCPTPPESSPSPSNSCPSVQFVDTPTPKLNLRNRGIILPDLPTQSPIEEIPTVEVTGLNDGSIYVPITDPCFYPVLASIRSFKRSRGLWTPEDETRYTQTLEQLLNIKGESYHAQND